MQNDQSSVKVANRLRRARGQLDSVICAVENGAPCRDVLTQLAAASSALDRAGFLIVAGAMRSCVTDSGRSDQSPIEDDSSISLDELEKLFLSLS